MGRFISADTIIPDVGNTLAWDRYAYGLNNPIAYNDPSGHDVGCSGHDASSCVAPGVLLPHSDSKNANLHIYSVAVAIDYREIETAESADTDFVQLPNINPDGISSNSNYEAPYGLNSMTGGQAFAELVGIASTYANGNMIRSAPGDAGFIAYMDFYYSSSLDSDIPITMIKLNGITAWNHSSQEIQNSGIAFSSYANTGERIQWNWIEIGGLKPGESKYQGQDFIASTSPYNVISYKFLLHGNTFPTFPFRNTDLGFFYKEDNLHYFESR